MSTLSPMMHASTPVPYHQHVPQMPQFPPVYPQIVLSDTDILRIATQVKVMISEEIEKLVNEKVNQVTTDLRQSMSALREENQRLRSSIIEVEAKMSAKVDDLEQYSRRSCLRIVVVSESEHENTDEIVLTIADRWNINISPDDIDRSHRVGSQKPTASREQPSRQIRSREIIVKFRNYQARLAFLKGRSVLREKREKMFIIEDLTQSRRSLAYECRQLKRDRKIQKTWVYDGNIFLSENNGESESIPYLSVR